jgi:hypothetical protein
MNMRAGALGFRDFPGLPVMKENRNGNHRTQPLHDWKFLPSLKTGATLDREEELCRIHRKI